MLGKIKEINGRVINATIYKEVNKCCVSVCIEELVIIPNLIPTKIIEIDLGIKKLLTTSDGYAIENMK